MSSCPGYRMEDYLMWAYDLTVEDQPDANTSLQIAESVGSASKKRRHLNRAEFNMLVFGFERFRDRIEEQLENYDAETSWRQYASSAFTFVHGNDEDQVDMWVNTMLQYFGIARVAATSSNAPSDVPTPLSEADAGRTFLAQYDDGSSVELATYAGGGAAEGAWSTLTLYFNEADGSRRIRSYRYEKPVLTIAGCETVERENNTDFCYSLMPHAKEQLLKFLACTDGRSAFHVTPQALLSAHLPAGSFSLVDVQFCDLPDDIIELLQYALD